MKPSVQPTSRRDRATAPEVIADEHVERNMLVAMERPAGDGDPVLIPGNPVKLSAVAEGTRDPGAMGR